MINLISEKEIASLHAKLMRRFQLYCIPADHDLYKEVTELAELAKLGILYKEQVVKTPAN